MAYLLTVLMALGVLSAFAGKGIADCLKGSRSQLVSVQRQPCVEPGLPLTLYHSISQI